MDNSIFYLQNTWIMTDKEKVYMSEYICIFTLHPSR